MMTRLDQLTRGEDRRLFDLLSEHFSCEEALWLLAHPGALASMKRAMMDHPEYRLARRRFRPLEEKIEIVKGWPDMMARFGLVAFDDAIERAKHSGLLARFAAASLRNPLLDLVITPYLGGVVETFRYGRDRLRETVGGAQYATLSVYEKSDLEAHLRLRKGIIQHTNCLRIEAIDLGAHWNRTHGFVPGEIEHQHRLAHAQVLFAAAQDPNWVGEMGQMREVPYVLMGGYELSIRGDRDEPGGLLPTLWYANGAKLSAQLRGGRSRLSALPMVWG